MQARSDQSVSVHRESRIDLACSSLLQKVNMASRFKIVAAITGRIAMTRYLPQASQHCMNALDSFLFRNLHDWMINNTHGVSL
jgi:hypothetical protein